MYSCHTGLSEDTKSTSLPAGSHQIQTSRHTAILLRTCKTNPTTRSGRTTGNNKSTRAASEHLCPNDFFAESVTSTSTQGVLVPTDAAMFLRVRHYGAVA